MASKPLEFVNETTIAIENKEYAAGMLPNLTKAFDTVNHETLESDE